MRRSSCIGVPSALPGPRRGRNPDHPRHESDGWDPLLASTAPGMSRIDLVPTGICRPVTALLAALVRTVFTRARLGAWNADNRRTRRGHWPASIFGRSIFGREERDMAQEALARLIAEAGIRRTLAEYCQTIDDGDFTALAGCFAPDARLIAFGTPAPPATSLSSAGTVRCRRAGISTTSLRPTIGGSSHSTRSCSVPARPDPPGLPPEGQKGSSSSPSDPRLAGWRHR